MRSRPTYNPLVAHPPQPQPPSHPEDLDALVAAPAHHALLFEDDSIRILNITVPPGDTVPLHTHCWPGPLHFLSWSPCIRRDAAGTILMDSRPGPPLPPGATTWSPPLEPHTLQNVGPILLHVIGIELKHPGSSPAGPSGPQSPALP